MQFQQICLMKDACNISTYLSQQKSRLWHTQHLKLLLPATPQKINDQPHTMYNVHAVAPFHDRLIPTCALKAVHPYPYPLVFTQP